MGGISDSDDPYIHDGARIYLRPAGFLAGGDAASAVAAGQAFPLAGGALAFTHVNVMERAPAPGPAPFLVAARDWDGWLAGQEHRQRLKAQAIFARLTGPRPGLGALVGAAHPHNAPLIMGILNVTPDSFADGGRYFSPRAAIEQGRKLADSGADILDIGGESTRPGATPVSEAEELDRVMPVIEGVMGLGLPLSIDTRHAAVMAAAVKSGARIINDVSALTNDPQSPGVAARLQASVVLMHAKGDPQTMQNNPQYDNVLLDVYDYLECRIAAAVAAGMALGRLIIDPGIGFGKNLEHNLALLSGLATFHGLGVPLLLGVSRKGFIGLLSGETSPAGRLPGSLAAGVQAVSQGAQILRVHDVAETAQALKTYQAIIGDR